MIPWPSYWWLSKKSPERLHGGLRFDGIIGLYCRRGGLCPVQRLRDKTSAGFEPIALLNLGASQVNFYVLTKDGPVFNRDIFFGGRQLTEQIQSLLNLSYEEAEKLKSGWDRPLDQMDRVGPSLLAIVQNWLEEIKKVLDVLTASDPEIKPAKIILSGGPSLLPGLPQFLSKGLQLPVELFNPFFSVRVDPETFDTKYLQSVGPQMAIALGLALRQKGAR